MAGQHVAMMLPISNFPQAGTGSTALGAADQFPSPALRFGRE
jgi:hypothetical protein